MVGVCLCNASISVSVPDMRQCWCVQALRARLDARAARKAAEAAKRARQSRMHKEREDRSSTKACHPGTRVSANAGSSQHKQCQKTADVLLAGQGPPDLSLTGQGPLDVLLTVQGPPDDPGFTGGSSEHVASLTLGKSTTVSTRQLGGRRGGVAAPGVGSKAGDSEAAPPVAPCRAPTREGLAQGGEGSDPLGWSRAAPDELLSPPQPSPSQLLPSHSPTDLRRIRQAAREKKQAVRRQRREVRSGASGVF
jgi:hypothetical protein